MKRLIVTEKDMKRYDVFVDVSKKIINLKQAQDLLGLSYRQTLRLNKKFKNDGLNGIIPKYKNQANNKKVDKDLEESIVRIYQRIYFDFNVSHFREKLEEFHNVKLSYETIRQILIKNDLHKPKKRKKVYRKRRRMPKAGMLIQMDSSLHKWLADVDEKYWLIACIDDATNEVASANFVKSDTTYTNMSVLQELIEKKGLFHALYVDKASHFITTRYKGIHQEIKDEQEETQIQRALEELGITLITANSPQAKGRIERLFGFFQDRLIKEMRLEGIKDYDSANLFLKQQFLPWYNDRYTHEAESVYKALPLETNLDLIFSIKHTRKVKKDNTISFNSEVIQLPPNKSALSYLKARVEIRVRQDNTAFILYKNKIILEIKLKKSRFETELEKRENVLSKQLAHC